MIERLKRENSERWRLVVFTGRRETQTTIQTFLEGHGLKVGIINGDSGSRNQETIERFRQTPPGYRVIVSTEAGSEGVNLQVANVLVNYDLPWNPMIVEQRIGRIQRLASEHAHVSIFNMTLRGTFEEYIVGRLIEKLQMAAHAIGDIEALLQGSDIGNGDDDVGFEDRILALVLAALAGKNVDEETRLAAKSIEDARAELEREEATINAMLGSMDGAEYVGPRAPKLPVIVRSMEPRDFALVGLQTLGVRVTPKTPDLYLAEEHGGREYIRFEERDPGGPKSTLYAPGSAAFQRLVSRVIATGVHQIEDVDGDPTKANEDIARRWVEGFGAELDLVEPVEARRLFNGTALLRVRATVAHDNYERLVDVPCSSDQHRGAPSRSSLAPLARTIEDPVQVGLDPAKLVEAASQDIAISEFSRFYLERRDQETRAAGSDERKRKKLLDEFTPRLEITPASIEGELHREVRVRVKYAFDAGSNYESLLTVTPHNGKIVDAPNLRPCARSNRLVPEACLAKCEISGAEVLRHLLVQSAITGRLAQPEYGVRCSLSGKRVLTDEVETSSVTGKPVASALLKTSAISGKRAEPEHFSLCAFTQATVLKSELAVSEISGQPYRVDEQVRSVVSGKTGHKQEFVECYETRQLIARGEAEQCEVTGRQVRSGLLERCDVTGKRVLPSELGRCAVTGRRVLKKLMVTSNLSEALLLEEAAIRSLAGRFCTPAEAQICFWSGRKSYPDDIRTCALTGLPIHADFTTPKGAPRLQPLVELLDGMRRTADDTALWDAAAARIAQALKGGRCRVEAAMLSPTKSHLATCSEVKTLLGLRVNLVGAIFDVGEQAVVGRLSVGKRNGDTWTSRQR